MRIALFATCLADAEALCEPVRRDPALSQQYEP